MGEKAQNMEIAFIFRPIVTPGDHSRNAACGEFMQPPVQMGESFNAALAANQEQNPQKVADAILSLVDSPAGKRPFRTVFDQMGMGDPIKGYNEQMEQMIRGIYGAFGIDGMLDVQS